MKETEEGFVYPDIALSIRQPWIELVLRKIKKIEIRTWACPKKHMGKRIGLHAGKQHDDRRFAWNHFPEDEWKAIGARRGMLLGEAKMIDCVKFTCHGHFAEYRSLHLNDIDDYEDGLYGFVFGTPVIYEKPIPLIGRLNFFNIDVSDMDVDSIGGGQSELFDGQTQ